MSQEPYYAAYEERYRRIYDAGGDRWGVAPDDADLVAVLSRWVDEHGLAGKRVLEFACGEGGAGAILSRLGCLYHGLDFSATALDVARATLAEFPRATVARHDMVADPVDISQGRYDAALDIMGLHLIVVDGDRARYLAHARAALFDGAPMLFHGNSYREDAYEGPVPDLEAFLATRPNRAEYFAPRAMSVKAAAPEVTADLPLLPARARPAEGYRREFAEAGFTLDEAATAAANWRTIHTHRAPETE